MKIEFYNPKHLKMPTNLGVIVDDKYIITYERNYIVKSINQLSYTFTLNLPDDVLKIDDIQTIMTELGKILISELSDEGIDLVFEDFHIKHIDNHKCIYDLLFYKT